MGRKSAVSRLDPRIREAVDAAIREGRATLDEIVALIQAMGGQASRTAVWRYQRKAEAMMERYRQAQAIAKVWVGKLEEDPQSDVGRLLSEMLRTVAFRQLQDLGEESAEVAPMDTMLLAKALDHLARADKASAEREIRVRKELAAKLSKLEAQAERAGGRLELEDLRRVREEIYGVIR